MTFRNLHAAMIRLAGRFRLRTSYDLYGEHRRSQVESTLHELAHGVDLAGRPLSSRQVTRLVTALSPRAADQHELRVLRIEVRVLRALDIRVSIRELIEHANWRRPNWRPGHAATAAISRRETRATAKVLALILTEAGVP